MPIFDKMMSCVKCFVNGSKCQSMLHDVVVRSHLGRLTV